ncbi:cadherin-like beta sandwich domain-containing protein [Enterococcus pallens]|uniref:Lipoprotein n=1 Tax=Enterococcus pallens ATCC BAA-351 TaxID=1158607 RepID=R2QLC8_9ENTE|nr:cadherin-like beta sandwich domain-containing protein [Enterococcus pallens]EOH95993.1 hypothetical protein UAU_01173 [Enterococcus pallens ATCC BAA-351]EOU21651.1 hypothetical protein I588_02498 [Enterococcus pallens ATCC BAA-351]OJG77726.1 hypothetical protein RV10_GL002257 [Enterococcus pallens]
MIKKALIGGVSFASLLLLLAACGPSGSSSSNSSKDSAATSQSTSMSSSKTSEVKAQAGEIIGKDSNADKTAVDITKPGDSVTFEVPAAKEEGYLHFAFMHAASGMKGWYFAPESKDGIALSKAMFDGDKTVNITDKVALFAAPDASTSKAVTANDGELKYGKASDYMTATVALKDGKYEVTIENTSAGDFETPFSSGVWELSNSKEAGFDHTASAALSKLATSGHRDDLYKEVQSEVE